MSNLKEQRPKLASAALEFDQSEEKALNRYEAAVEGARKELEADRKNALDKLQGIISSAYGESQKEALIIAPLEIDSSDSMEVKVTTEE